MLRKGKTEIAFHLTVPYVSSIIETNGQFQHPTLLEVHSVLEPASNGCKDSLGVDQCVLHIPAFPYNGYDSDSWKKTHAITVYHIDTENYEIVSPKTFRLKTIRRGHNFWHDRFFDNVTVL